MEELITTFKGHSGCKVELYKDKAGVDPYYVLKSGTEDQIKRNVVQMRQLEKIYVPLPKIYYVTDTTLKMEYIEGIDMSEYLHLYNVTYLCNFIDSSIKKFQGVICKNYQKAYEELLYCDELKKWWGHLPFSIASIMKKLPRIIPTGGMNHGDMTLENIIYSEEEDKFYWIDPVTSSFDSWVFDAAKLRQDVECQWFMRNSWKLQSYKNERIINNLQYLKNELACLRDSANDYHLILMLLRVLRHCQLEDSNSLFLLRHINRLWWSNAR